MTCQASFIYLVAALLAVSEAQVFVDCVVHVDVKDPISDVITLFISNKVLVWKGDLKRRWDVSLLEI